MKPTFVLAQCGESKENEKLIDGIILVLNNRDSLEGHVHALTWHRGNCADGLQ
jgi:hypothetical protein